VTTAVTRRAVGGAAAIAVAIAGVLAVALDRVLGRLGFVPSAIETFVVIAAPPEAVWPELADVERQPRWMTDLKRVEILDDGATRVGTRAVGHVRILGLAVADPVTITAFDAPRRFAIRHDGRFRGEGMLTLEPGADGTSTIVRWTERLEPPVLPRLAGLTQGPVLREIFQADLHRLRRLLESNGGA
jgi:uncharacterized membrane protein